VKAWALVVSPEICIYACEFRPMFGSRARARRFTLKRNGDTVQVDTVDGPVSMKIPPGTQSGDELRLRGKGVPSGRGRGDQIVVMQVSTPTKLDKNTKRLLEELNLRED
jgi:DnaJ-class molecular chaperone